MKWTDFFLWSGVLYLLYYGVNVLLDISRAGRPLAENSTNDVLHFTEQVTVADATAEIPPPVIAPEPVEQPPVLPVKEVAKSEPVKQDKPLNAVEGSGVTIKDFWEMANKDAFEYEKNVSFA